MTRILPLLLPRVAGEWASPVETQQFPASTPRFLHGDPRAVVPQTCEALGNALLPHGAEEGDLLMAPMPRPGEEALSLLEILEPLAPQLPVLLYGRDLPVLGNVRCGNEELQLLPAQRTVHLLRASMWAEKRPGLQTSLQSRVYLSLALDHWRSLLLIHGWAEHPRLVGEVRLDGELDFLPGARAPELFEEGANDWKASRPTRLHLPWWASRRVIDWKINAEIAQQWPRDWGEVEVQVQVGRRFRRVSATEYFTAFRVSGSSRRLFLGGPKLGAKELAALAKTAPEGLV